MDNKPLFSIVMPVYNVEKYLRDAVESVLQQTYPRFELLLVDDCSPDNSPAICDELAATDARIRVIHKHINEGPSMARNTGISEAVGEYISFMDSDDTIDTYLLSDVANSLAGNPAQCVMFGVEEEYYNKAGELKEANVVTYPGKAFCNQCDLRQEIILIEKSTLYGYSANKFYEVGYLKKIGIMFDKNLTLLEDISFNVEFFMNAESLNILESAPYHYKKRGNGSITDRFDPDYFKLHTDRIAKIKAQYIYWNLYTSEVKVVLASIYCRYIFSALQRNYDKQAGMSRRDRRKWIKALFLDDLFNELIPLSQPDSLVFKAMTLLLKKRCIFLLLLCSKMIFIIKNKLPILFAKAKQNR